jgi:hypothetical protein
MRKAFFLIPALFIAFYFFHSTGLGLRADFSHDDLMNMNWSLARSYPDNLKDLVLFWRPTPTYRPVGALVYKVSLDLAGLNLFPLRVFCYILMSLNLFLLYAVARRLSGSREIAVLAALLCAYHRGLSGLYFNNGTLYDILCFFFTFAALLFYIRARQAGRPLSPVSLCGFCFLCLLALNSKEMALAVPFFVGFYELLFHPPGGLSAKQALAWLRQTAPGPAVSALIAAIYYFGRITGPDGVASSGAYNFHVSLAEYLKQTGHYVGDTFYKVGWFTPPKTTVFLLVLFGLAWLFRSRLLGFSAAFFATGILPLAFISPRGLNAAYIPVAGLAVYCAGVLVLSRDVILGLAAKRLGHKTGGQARSGVTAREVLLFALVAYCLIRIHPDMSIQYDSWQVEYGQIRSFMGQLERLHPTMPKGARILIVKDPFGEYLWAGRFIVSLVYRNPDLRVVRLESAEKKPAAAEVAEYYARLSYEDGRLRDLSPAEVPLGP